MSKKKTTWFKPGTKPYRTGVYETENGFQHFLKKEEVWGCYCSNPKSAANWAGVASCYQSPKWRGFTTDQTKRVKR